MTYPYFKGHSSVIHWKKEIQVLEEPLSVQEKKEEESVPLG